MRSRRKKPGIVVKRDGREVCRTPYQWAARRNLVWLRDGKQCVRCGREVPLHDVFDGDTGVLRQRAAEIHHKHGRGLGGSLRDDRPEALETMCWSCHNIRHASAKAVPAKQL